jgi:hypothetical protein
MTGSGQVVGGSPISRPSSRDRGSLLKRLSGDGGRFSAGQEPAGGGCDERKPDDDDDQVQDGHAAQGVEVGAVPGDEGEVGADATGVDAGTARERIVASMGGFATGRFSTPEEVATLVALLASERTANVTGANYIFDGDLIKTT